MGILSLKSKSTTSQEKFEMNKKSDASLLFSDSENIEDFSIELTVGDQWAEDLSKEQAVMYGVENKTVVLKPKTSIILEVKETINVPFNMYGIILQTGSIFIEQGILIGAGKIEPSYNGKLQLLVYNTSKTKRTLKQGQKIASAIFMRTEHTLNTPINTTNRKPIFKKSTLVQRISNFFLNDMKFTLPLIVSIIAILISTYNINNKQDNNNISQKSKVQKNLQKENK